MEGRLPCQEIGSISGGERIRVEFEMPATDEVVTGEGGEFSSLLWRLRGRQELSARIPIPMDEE